MSEVRTQVFGIYIPLYAPGNETVLGVVLPPPVILSCAHSIYPDLSDHIASKTYEETHIKLCAWVALGAMQSLDRHHGKEPRPDRFATSVPINSTRRR